nr:unnamed protein product [Haemonchus contortus]
MRAIRVLLANHRKTSFFSSLRERNHCSYTVETGSDLHPLNCDAIGLPHQCHSMNLLLFLIKEIQSVATLIPILGLFILRSYLLPTEVATNCNASDRDSLCTMEA